MRVFGGEGGGEGGIRVHQSSEHFLPKNDQWGKGGGYLVVV